MVGRLSQADPGGSSGDGPTAASGKDAQSSETAGVPVPRFLFPSSMFWGSSGGDRGWLKYMDTRGVEEQAWPGSLGRVSHLQQSCQCEGGEGHLPPRLLTSCVSRGYC